MLRIKAKTFDFEKLTVIKKISSINFHINRYMTVSVLAHIGIDSSLLM